jgi:hypothetical protein
MGELREKLVAIDADGWRATAEAARESAVKWAYGATSSDRLAKAAEMLRAADTFEGRANMLDLGEGLKDSALIDYWDLSDEGQPGVEVRA